MADRLIAQEQAYSTLQNVAQVLDAELYNPHTTQRDTLRPGAHRILFMIDPPDIRAWLPGDDITLVCMSNNLAQTFWSFVAERTADLALETKTKQWTTTSPAADAFEGVSVEKLPDNGAVFLKYCRMPPLLDLALVQEYGLPQYPATPSISIHNKHRRSSVAAALTLAGQVSDSSIARYHELRSRAEDRGILSKDFGVLVPSTEVAVEADVKAPEAHSTRDSAAETAAYRKALLEQALVGAVESSDELFVEYEWPFRSKYTRYVELKCRCWNAKAAHKIWPHLVDMSKAVLGRPWLLYEAASGQTRLVTHKLAEVAKAASTLDPDPALQPGVHLWPAPFQVPDQKINNGEASWAVLIGVHDVSPISASNLGAQDDRLDRSDNDALVFEDDDFLISIAIRERQSVQAYVPAQPRDIARLQQNQPVEDASQLHKEEELADSETPPRFRNAAQMLSRLRWDPQHSGEAYEVGYLDRFEGLKWTSLQSWGKPIEDEEFIPEHRIRMFRRVRDGRIIWDRVRRIDDSDSKCIVA